MPICIECSYPVPQLYQRLSSKKKATAPPTTSHSRSSSGHHHHNHTSTPKDEGSRGFGEAKKTNKGNASADVRLMQCPRCKRFADKYVEHDFVVLFIDLVLVKPQVYRHLLFNNTRLIAADKDKDSGSNTFTPAVNRLGTLLVLFDVYLIWSAIEALPSESTVDSAIPKLPILVQYLFYLVLCTLTTGVQHVVIRELAQLEWFRGTTGNLGFASPAGTSVSGNIASPINPTASGLSVNQSPKKHRAHATQNHAGPTSNSGPKVASPPPSRPPSAASTSGLTLSTAGQQSQTPSSGSGQTSSPLPPPRKNAVSTALMVSSCTKLFPILMVVWTYEDTTGQLASGVNWAVAIQNVEALRILLGSGYGSATILVAIGWLASWLVSRVVLSSVGLGGV